MGRIGQDQEAASSHPGIGQGDGRHLRRHAHTASDYSGQHGCSDNAAMRLSSLALTAALGFLFRVGLRFSPQGAPVGGQMVDVPGAPLPPCWLRLSPPRHARRDFGVARNAGGCAWLTFKRRPRSHPKEAPMPDFEVHLFVGQSEAVQMTIARPDMLGRTQMRLTRANWRKPAANDQADGICRQTSR